MKHLIKYIAPFLIPTFLLTQSGCLEKVDTTGIEQATEDANGAFGDGFFSWASGGEFSKSEISMLELTVNEAVDRVFDKGLSFSSVYKGLSFSSDRIHEFYGQRDDTPEVLGQLWRRYNLLTINDQLEKEISDTKGEILEVHTGSLSGNENKLVFYLFHNTPKKLTSGFKLRINVDGTKESVKEKNLNPILLSKTKYGPVYVDKITLSKKEFDSIKETGGYKGYELLFFELTYPPLGENNELKLFDRFAYKPITRQRL